MLQWCWQWCMQSGPYSALLLLSAGQTFPAAAEPGGRHILHVLITDTDACQLCAALDRMQQRMHPDTTEFTLRFKKYNELYECQKVAQICAQAQLPALATELQVPSIPSQSKPGKTFGKACWAACMGMIVRPACRCCAADTSHRNCQRCWAGSMRSLKRLRQAANQC